jgi:hypothetical protein
LNGRSDGAVSDNTVLEGALQQHGLLCVDDLVHALTTIVDDEDAAATFGIVQKFLWPFRLAERVLNALCPSSRMARTMTTRARPFKYTLRKCCDSKVMLFLFCFYITISKCIPQNKKCCHAILILSHPENSSPRTARGQATSSYNRHENRVRIRRSFSITDPAKR